MSTILKALRRLENEKQEQQASERLHGEVVAPAPPSRGASWQRALLLLGAGLVAAGLGAAVYVFVLGDPSSEEIEVASNVANVEGTNPAAASPGDSGIEERPSAAIARAARNTPPAAASPSPSTPSAAELKRTTANEVALQRAEKRKQRLAARAANKKSIAAARTSAAAATPRVAPAGEPDRGSEAPAPKNEAALSETPVEDLPLEVPPVRRAPKPSPTPKSSATASAPQPATRSASPSPVPSSSTSSTTPTPTPTPTTATTTTATTTTPPTTPPKAPPTTAAASRSSAAGGALVFEIARTIWHPQPDRRVAYLQNADGERVEVREGDLHAGWRIDGISPSSVRFARADETTNRRVGQSAPVNE